MQKIFLTSILLLGLLCANAQYTISGKIISADTKQPIPSASVFFSNTSKGNATNNEGEFILDNINAGKIELVVSCVGYETYVLQTQPEKITAPLRIELQIKVKPLEEVVLGSYLKEGWLTWGKFFIENFIGSTTYAEDCKIKNPEVIQFRNYKKEGILKAFSDETLEIENKSLGYIIHYKLEQFECNFISKTVAYQGYPLFENMQTKRSGLKRRWQANREKVYHGSQMHFMRSLFRNKIIEEGFEIRRLVKIPNLEKQRVKTKLYPGGLIITYNTNDFLLHTIYEDSIAHFDSILRQTDIIDFVYPTLLTGNSIAYFLDTVTAGMRFSDYLQITYTKTIEDYDYFKKYDLERSLWPGPPVSFITLINNNPIEILSNGAIFEALDLLNLGYWSWSEKMATSLPFDYWPDSK